MARATIDTQTKAVLFYVERIKQTNDICTSYDISRRTLTRWVRAYRRYGTQGLAPKKPGPRHSKHSIADKLEQKIVALKQRHSSWGARRIKHQYDLPSHWRTVHRVIKRHQMLVRIKPKPQPPMKRLQLKHVDSMWQGDSFQFRISSVGKVYVTRFTDGCSRYRVESGAYLHKGADEAIDSLRHALSKGRIPREIYLDNAKQFTAEEFRAELAKHHIKPIYGKPYHPRGRGKIESYHKVLYRELIKQVRSYLNCLTSSSSSKDAFECFSGNRRAV